MSPRRLNSQDEILLPLERHQNDSIPTVFVILPRVMLGQAKHRRFGSMLIGDIPGVLLWRHENLLAIPRLRRLLRSQEGFACQHE